jgi:hypothetical protein
MKYTVEMVSGGMMWYIPNFMKTDLGYYQDSVKCFSVCIRNRKGL